MSKKKKRAKKQPKRNRYTPMGNAVNSEVAIVQAALLLDEASHNALESKDTEAIAGVARGWMELGVVLHNMSVGGEDEEEDDGDVTSDTSILGFGSAESREVAENARKSKS